MSLTTDCVTVSPPATLVRLWHEQPPRHSGNDRDVKQKGLKRHLRQSTRDHVRVITYLAILKRAHFRDNSLTAQPAKKKLLFSIKRRAKKQRGISSNTVLKVKPTNTESVYYIFFINRPDVQVVLTPQIFMILYLQSSFCCSATWFYIYRWLWDHSLLSYSNIINEHISSSCINRDLTLHDRATKMENFSRRSWLLLSVILLEMSSIPPSILVVFGISPFLLYQDTTPT